MKKTPTERFFDLVKTVKNIFTADFKCVRHTKKHPITILTNNDTADFRAARSMLQTLNEYSAPASSEKEQKKLVRQTAFINRRQKKKRRPLRPEKPMRENGTPYFFVTDECFNPPW